jgi:hypothetical protein
MSSLPLLGINSTFGSYKSLTAPSIPKGLSLISYDFDFVVPPFRFLKKGKRA